MLSFSSHVQLFVSMDCSSTRLLCPWDSPGQNTGLGSLSLLRDLPNPGIEPRSPSLQVISLPAEPPEKPKNTGVGNLSLLQGIFLTQGSNQGLLLCRQILYQLSYQGSPGVIHKSTEIISKYVCLSYPVSNDRNHYFF